MGELVGEQLAPPEGEPPGRHHDPVDAAEVGVVGAHPRLGELLEVVVGGEGNHLEPAGDRWRTPEEPGEDRGAQELELPEQAGGLRRRQDGDATGS